MATSATGNSGSPESCADMDELAQELSAMRLQNPAPKALRALIAEELQKERKELLAGVQKLLLEQKLGYSPQSAHSNGRTSLQMGAHRSMPAMSAKESMPFATVLAAGSRKPSPSLLEKSPTLRETSPVLSEMSPVLSEMSLRPQETSPHSKEKSPDLSSKEPLPWTFDQVSSMTPRVLGDIPVEEGQPESQEALWAAAIMNSLPAVPDIPLNIHNIRQFLNPQELVSGNAVHHVVDSKYFEVACSLVIFMNVVFMACEMQYGGLDIGYKARVASFDRPAKEAWPHGEVVFFIAEITFNSWFVVELLLRIAADPSYSTRCPWIWLDAFLVGTSLAELSGAMPFDPSMLRMLRFLRLLRMIRLAKNIGALESLLVFMTAIQESIGALVWAFVVLLLIQLAVGMVLHQALAIFMKDESNDPGARLRVFKYFGNFTRTMMTMFEITLANWVTTCRLLQDDVSEWFGLFYVLYRCCFCFGVVKVVTAVFIAQTNRAMAKDDDLVMIVQQQERVVFRKKMEEIFDCLDTSRDGYLTWGEFKLITENDRWKSWAAKLGLPMNDLIDLFDLLAGSDGRVSAKEFFAGVERLKGAAKALDMVWLLSEFTKLIEQTRCLSRPGYCEPEPLSIERSSTRILI